MKSTTPFLSLSLPVIHFQSPYTFLPSLFLNSTTNLIYTFIGNSWVLRIHNKNLKKWNVMTFATVFKTYKQCLGFLDSRYFHHRKNCNSPSIAMFHIGDMRAWLYGQFFTKSKMKNYLLFWNIPLNSQDYELGLINLL